MKADKLYYIVFSLFRPFYVEKPVPVLRKKKNPYPFRLRTKLFKKILLRSFSVPRFQKKTRPCSVPVLKFQNQPVYVPFPFPYMGTGTGKCTDSVPVLQFWDFSVPVPFPYLLLKIITYPSRLRTNVSFLTRTRSVPVSGFSKLTRTRTNVGWFYYVSVLRTRTRT